MSYAYVMISSELGSEKKVVEELELIPQVEEMYIVYGIYDIVTKVKFTDRNELKKFVFEKIREIKHIKTTETLETYPTT